MLRLKWTLTVAIMLLAIPSAHADILLNSGFESGTGADASDWTEVSGASGVTLRSSDQPHSGGFSAYMAFDHINNTAAGAAYFFEQQQAPNSINNSLNYNLSFWAKADSNDFTGADMFFQLIWLDQDGSHGGGVKGETLVSLVANGLNSNYQQFFFNDLNAADGADSFLLRFQVSAGAVDNIANGMHVDDASFAAVPEPGATSILAFGGLLCCIQRRRTRKIV